MRKYFVLFVVLFFCGNAYAANVDISAFPALGTPAEATDGVVTYDSSAAAGSRATVKLFDGTATNFLNGAGSFSAETDPTVDTSVEIQTIIGSGVYEDASSNDIDPDRLNGDTTPDNLIDNVILQPSVALKVDQTASLGNTGTLTPTAGYDRVDVSLTCTADPSAIVLTEGGSETAQGVTYITNVGSNTCTFAYAAGVFEHPGGAGTSITLEQGQSLIVQYKTDRWYQIGGVNSTLYVNTIASSIPHPPEVTTKSGAYTIGTDVAAECYGGMVYVTSAATITACDGLADGMNFCVATVGAIAVSLDTQSDDLMYLNGVITDDGDKATNTSTTGDQICCTYYSADGWWCQGYSPDGDPWTDGGA